MATALDDDLQKATQEEMDASIARALQEEYDDAAASNFQYSMLKNQF